MTAERWAWPSRRRLDRLGFVIGLLGLTAAACAGLWDGRLVVQRHGSEAQSVPFRLGLRLAASDLWVPGELVQFHARDLAPYYPAGTAMTKIVAAVPGDRLRLEHRTFSVNGVPVGVARDTDAAGRPAPLYAPHPGPDGACSIAGTTPSPLPVTTECTLPAGTLFVLGTHARSFDGRYWGLVTDAEVMGRVVPIL
jgi:type IV secretory pathway protease TraF